MAGQNPLFGLSSRFRARAKYVTKNSDELTRRVVKAVVTELVWSTPVLTGRARSNWRTLFYRGDNVKYWPKPWKPSSPIEGAYEALQEADETVSFYTGRRSIFVTNNVPYIQLLNAGSSSQAPAGFIEMAVQAARETIEARPVIVEREL